MKIETILQKWNYILSDNLQSPLFAKFSHFKRSNVMLHAIVVSGFRKSPEFVYLKHLNSNYYPSNVLELQGTDSGLHLTLLKYPPIKLYKC